MGKDGSARAGRVSQALRANLRRRKPSSGDGGEPAAEAQDRLERRQDRLAPRIRSRDGDGEKSER